ncbi:MAG: GntR family transcriptional regulator [Desulfobacterales bacterium]|nr:GntR family transcriptional regulator [Desulfobacterales bacterium]
MPRRIEKIKGREDHTLKAFNGIRRMLFHNEIAPGQKIVYGDLAKRLDMSPTPVIQALKWLEFQGIVRREPNRGYFTEPISLKEVREIYEMRSLVELALLPKIIENLDESGIRRLKNALEEHRNASSKVYLNERLLKDMDFHLTLASLSGCTVQQKILKDLFDLLYLKYRGSILFVNFMDTVDTAHRDIFDAVTHRDPLKAHEVLATHLTEVKKHVLEGLSRMIAEKEDSTF